MAEVSTNFKRLFVRNLLWTAQADSTTLLAILKTLADARIEATQKGKVIISTAGNGHTTSFQIPSDFSPSDAADLIGELVDRYYEARDKLIADGTASPTDTQIHDEMLAKLRPIRTLARDYFNLRTEPEEITT